MDVLCVGPPDQTREENAQDQLHEADEGPFRDALPQGVTNEEDGQRGQTHTVFQGLARQNDDLGSAQTNDG